MNTVIGVAIDLILFVWGFATGYVIGRCGKDEDEHKRRHT